MEKPDAWEKAGGSLNLDTRSLKHRSCIFFLAETKFIWKSPQLCRKIEVPKVFISEENKTPYFSPALLNGSQKAVK